MYISQNLKDDKIPSYLSIVIGRYHYFIERENDLYKITDEETSVYFYITTTRIFEFFSQLYDRYNTQEGIQYELSVCFLREDEEICVLLHVDNRCRDKKKFKRQFRRFMNLRANIFGSNVNRDSS